MNGMLGQITLWLALLIAFAGMCAGFYGAQTNHLRATRIARVASLNLAVLVTLAFVMLINAFATSDFSLKVVYQNSHTAKPLIYKLAGTWGNHEGSMLLWVWVLAALAGMVAWFGRKLPQSFYARVLGTQLALTTGFLTFLVLTSNPFWMLPEIPPNGLGLNPLLQDPGLAFHPPFLYLGYVGLSVAFSFSIAALLEGKIDGEWAKWVRPWTLIAWSALTLGIAMGSWWAYYELGWGGFWFWDPVENASLMPWLAATALIHSIAALNKRGVLKSWTLLMAITAFGASLIGAFIVRSGVVTSVHAFANDPERGVLLLLLAFLFTGGGFVLFALKSKNVSSEADFKALSKETALILNNLFLMVIFGVVMLGTFWPVISEVIATEKISVGAPFFNEAVLPIALLLAVIIPLGPLTNWRASELFQLFKLVRWPLALTALALIVAYLVIKPASFQEFGLIALCLWIVLGAIYDVLSRLKLGRISALASLKRLIHLQGSVTGGALAHFGVGLLILGILGASLQVKETIEVLEPDESLSLNGYELTYKGTKLRQIANYQTQMALIEIRKNGKYIGELFPELRYYPVARQQTTEAAIMPMGTSDIYVAIGEPREETGQTRVIRSYYHPFVYLIWGGAILMSLGGLLALRSRKKDKSL